MPTLYKQFVVNYPTLASFSTGYIHGSSDTYTLHTRLFNKESTSYTIPIDKEYVIDMNSLIRRITDRIAPLFNGEDDSVEIKFN